MGNYPIFKPFSMKLIDKCGCKTFLQKTYCHPGKAFNRFLAVLSHTPQATLKEYQQELISNTYLQKKYVNAIEKKWIPNKYGTWEKRFSNLSQSAANISWFYALLRELKPARVIETGTNAGSMTSVILAAIEKNGSGELVSIDIPTIKERNFVDLLLPDDQQPGYLIPEEYKKHWELRLGDAKDLLMPSLREKPCDVFIHDSLHTYEHMYWEFISAYCTMKPNGIILSDDTLWNNAWWDFTNNFSLPRFQDISNPHIGATIITHESKEKNKH